MKTPPHNRVPARLGSPGLRRGCAPCQSGGFTLVEVLVSTALISVILLVLASMTDAARRTWSYTTGRVEQFRDAREAFESITRKLGQATLNTYWDYDSVTAPTKYLRQSELRFISGNAATLIGGAGSHPGHAMFFQAPLGYVNDQTYSGMGNLLNTWGYFVEYGDDSKYMPSFANGIVPVRKRFRAMELMEPSESLTLYNAEIAAGGNGKYTGKDWFQTPLAKSVNVLAENVIALVLLPKLTPADQAAGGYNDASLAKNYSYDSTQGNPDKNLNSKNQLPPVVQVTLVAIDEASANRMKDVDVTALTAKLGSLFTDATQFSKDLNKDPAAVSDGSLESYLTTNKINYRMFTTNVGLRAAKWSREQTN